MNSEKETGSFFHLSEISYVSTCIDVLIGNFYSHKIILECPTASLKTYLSQIVDLDVESLNDLSYLFLRYNFP